MTDQAEKPDKKNKPKKDKEPKKLNLRFFFLGVIIFLFILSIFSPGAIQAGKYQQINFSQLITMVNSKQVQEITINNMSMSAQGTLSDGVMFQTNIINYPGLLESLQSSGAQITIKNADNGILVQILIQLLPFLIIIGIWFFIFRQAQGVNNQAMSFGKSRAKPWKKEADEKKTTFKDAGGIREAVEELEEIVDFLKNPSKYLSIGAKIPRGVLLMGPPGTGKTLLAKAIAGEADVAFFSLSASEFVEMFVGVGASRVRDLFAQAKKNQPSIIFIDEIDAVGRHRGAGFGGGHDEREQTLNQLLVELDGFDDKSSTIVIAATNRPDILDKALLRPGRFDRQIVIDAPDIVGRKEILEIHKRKKKLAATVDLGVIAKRTPGFSGADLANVINEAALLSARRNRKSVGMKELEEAIDRVIAGPQKKSKIMEESERKTIAFHELGHAIVAKSLAATDPVHKISILPRGMALGYTLQLPEKDRFLRSETDLKNDITILMGGRAAEKVFLNEITTGASNDIKRATKLAHDIICKYGMSPLGNRAFGKDQENVFLGRDFGDHAKDYSEKTATDIDAELNKVLDDCYQAAIAIVKENKQKLEKIAEILLKKEVLEGKEFEALLK
ncbi:MAG: ATP-dependent zinc metalloprotease FtsH [Candidatus Margulisbacteria bacterium]|nr:ATP-dependent zinc metalloprotease FtsH [Candidatus Margulisiibacteriota bacterium]